MIKLDILDTHDRLTHLKSHDHSISECCQNLIDQAPFGIRPFYIFAHGRTDDNGKDTRVIWQPRLTKPKAQTNSMLFKGYPGRDQIDIIWIIPKRELWPQYQKGKITESEVVSSSIKAFLHDRKRLESPDKNDPNDEEIEAIYTGISLDAKRNKMMERLYIPQIKQVI